MALKLTGNKLEGYIAVYDSDSLPIQEGRGQFIESIQRGAFSKELNSGKNIRAVVAHDGTHVLASTKAKTLTLREDDTGVYAEITLPDTTIARDIKTLVNNGEEFGGSFRALSAKAIPSAGKKLITEINDLVEVTVTAMPAYQETLSRSIQSLQEEKEITMTELNNKEEAVAVAPAPENKPTIEVKDIERSAMADKEFKPVNPVIGLNDKEKKQYSIYNAVRCIANHKPLSGLEKECSDEIARQVGSDPKGHFYFPANEIDYGISRANPLNTTTLSALQTTTIQGFVPMLFNKLAFVAAGGRTMSGLVGTVKIPKQTAASSVFYATSEGADISQTNPTATGSLTLAPKTVGAWAKIERSQYSQTSYDAEAFTRGDILNAMALGIDEACFAGTGANGQPQGLLYNTNIDVYTNTSGSGTLTRTDLYNMVGLIEDANVAASGISFAVTPLIKYKLKVTPKIGSTFPEYIWNDGDAGLLGYNTVVSNQLKSKTDEYNSVVHNLIVGDFSQAVLGTWTVLDMQVDTITYATSGAVRLIALQDFDFGVLRPEAFVAAQNITVS